MFETLSADVLEFLDELEADLGVPLDFDADDDDEGGWDLFGWDGPDEEVE